MFSFGVCWNGMPIAIEWCLERGKRWRTLPADPRWKFDCGAFGNVGLYSIRLFRLVFERPIYSYFLWWFVVFAQSISIIFTINFAGDALQRERVMNVCFSKIIRTFEATTIRQPRIMLIDQLRYGSNSCFAANYSVSIKNRRKTCEVSIVSNFFWWLNSELFAQSREKESFQA